MSATSFQRQRRMAASAAVLAFAEIHGERIVNQLLTETLGISIADVEGFVDPARVHELLEADDIEEQLASVNETLAELDAFNGDTGPHGDGGAGGGGDVTIVPAPGSVAVAEVPPAGDAPAALVADGSADGAATAPATGSKPRKAKADA